MSFIKCVEEENVAYISLDRPEKYNSFNREMSHELIGVLEKCRYGEHIRAISITGTGKAFCAGQDLNEILDPEAPGISEIVSQHYNPMIQLLRTIEKPIVMAVNGVAAGAGANIALAGDIVVAHEKAQFVQAFSKIGLIPDSGGTYVLPRLVGWQRATALMMLAENISAHEAKAMGMIYEVYSDEDFEISSKNLVRRLAKLPTKALGLTKRALNASMNNDLATQLALEDELQSTSALTADYREGVDAFLEKRKPNFKGK